MQHWDDLQAGLSSEVSLLERAITLAEQKRQTLVQNDVTALDTLLPAEEALAGQLQDLEFSLTRTIGILAGCVGANSLIELIEAPECPNSQLLQPLYQQMVVRLAGLQQANRQNHLLIEQALAFVEYSLKLFTSTSNDPAYDSVGRATQQKAARLIDRKL